MRRRLVFSLAVLAGLSAVLAAPAGAKTVVVTQPKLRSVQSLAPAKAAAAPASPTAPPPGLWIQADADATQCRTACAQQRYMCDANSGSDDCAATWGQCVAGCSSPNISSALNPIPPAN
ncbi:hypothetical protein ACO2Q3_18635 [Caulobacter sp. KR2-114]|uniref:hypothetical protein n=1 Tax=Caulobacter sp. KR2-114 TaxID=3400912 RepID=UPI003BFCFCBB